MDQRGIAGNVLSMRVLLEYASGMGSFIAQGKPARGVEMADYLGFN